MKATNDAPALCLVLAVLVLGGCEHARLPSSPVAPPIVKTQNGGELITIPAGFFAMGSRYGRDDEKPVHKVWIDSFLIDRHEVTQAEYERIGKIEAFPNPSHFQGADLPVDQVTWPQAARFCNARSRFEGLTPCYNEDSGTCDFTANGYRLPTEAEWEYACRAGSPSEYAFGDDSRQLGIFAWFADNSAKKTHSVGLKKPNAWGLFDMHGNVAEWCQDRYSPRYYETSPEKCPQGPDAGDDFVLRGGSWKSLAEALRSATRAAETPGFSDACLARDAIGFRCIRKAPASKDAG